MIKGIIVILIALFIELCAFWSVEWNPFNKIKEARSSSYKFGPISIFIVFWIITLMVLFFIGWGIYLL